MTLRQAIDWARCEKEWECVSFNSSPMTVVGCLLRELKFQQCRKQPVWRDAKGISGSWGGCVYL